MRKSLLATIAFTLLFIIYFVETQHYRQRAITAERVSQQHHARMCAALNKAEIRTHAAEQAKQRNNLLAAHNKELLEENARLHERVLYLSNMSRYVDGQELDRMAKMDGPSGTIFLN